jgi:hypothetical protein
MAYIRDNSPKEPDVFGESIKNALHGLAQNKMAEIHHRQQTNSLQQLLGISGEQAHAVASLPKDLQQTMIKDYLSQGSFPGQQQQQVQMQQQGQQQQMPGQQLQQEQMQGQPQSRDSLIKLLNNPRLKPEHRLKVEHLLQQREKQERPFYNKTLEGYKHGREALEEISKATSIIQSGKSQNAIEHSWKKFLGKTFKVNLADLQGADTEQLEKIYAGFQKGARDWFPGRVTDRDLAAFVKTLPDLSKTTEGQLRILSSMKARAEAQVVRYEALKQIRQLNHGRLPPYAEELVEEAVGPQLDALAEGFISGSSVPKMSAAAVKQSTRGSWKRWAQAGGDIGVSLVKTGANAVTGLGQGGIHALGGHLAGKAKTGLGL